MTAESGADCLDGCLASGMDDMLLKPIRMEELSATAAALDHRRIGKRQLGGGTRELSSSYTM